MKTGTKEKIVKEVIGWIDDSNPQRSGNQLAKKIEISNASLSKIKNNKLEGVANETLNKIASFFHIREEEQSWDHFNTPNFKAINEVLINAKTFQRRALIDGNSGFGKSYSIWKYCRQIGNEEAVHILCRRSMNPRKFVQHIAKKLGLNKYLGNRFDMEEAIARKLVSMHKPLLILDEFENLSDANYSSVKAIIDLTDRRCAVVLVGIEIYHYLQVGASKGKDAFRQLVRRFPESSVEVLNSLEFKGIKSILNHMGITDKYVHEWFYENIFDYDAMENVVRDLIRIAKANNLEITRELVDQLFGSKRSVS